MNSSRSMNFSLNNNFFEKQKHSRLILILLILAYVFLMFGNGIVSLTHPDEVFYVQTAKEMISHNSWLTPMIFDEPQFEKPIFFYWLLAGAIKFFGLNPFGARFWPAFFGILGVLVTYWIAWTLFQNKRLAFLSGMVLTTSFIYLALSRAVLTDMVFSIFVVISIGFFYWGYRYPGKRDLGIVLGFAFIGLSVLTKGLLGFLIPLKAILFFLLYKRDTKYFLTPATFWGILILLLLAVPWHVLMVQWYGQTFIDEYWHNVHIRRLFVAEHPRNNTWYFYLGLMFGGMMPWSLFLIPAMYTGYKIIKNSSRGVDQFGFLAFWILSVFLFVQPAQSKLASYIFPIFPAVAIILGHYLHEYLDRPRVQAFDIIGVGMSMLVMGGSIAAIIFSKKYIEMVAHLGPTYVFSTLAFICGVALLYFTLKKKYVFAICTNAVITLIILTTLFLGKPYAEPWVSCERVSEEFKKMDHSDTVVLSSKFYVRGIRFYTNRRMAVIDINGKGFYSPHPIPFLNTDQKVLDFLETQNVTYGIVKPGDLKQLERITAGRYRMTSHHGDGGKYIVKIERI